MIYLPYLPLSRQKQRRLIQALLLSLIRFSNQIPITAYLVDAFPEYAASATAAGTIVRSIVGAVLPLAGPSMYAKLGLGWGNTLLAFLALACLPLPFWLMKYGEHVRTHPDWQVKL